MNPPVAVTGVGVLGPSGAGGEALAAALAEGRPLDRPLERDARYHHPRARCRAARLPEVDLDSWVHPREGRRMSALSRMAVAAARMALDDAGLPRDGARRPPTAVVVATVFGASTFTEHILLTVDDADQGPELVSPFHFTDCVANAPAGQIAIATGSKGPNTTYCQREAGALMALHRGVRELQSGRARIALVGSVDEMGPLVHALLDRMGILTRSGRAWPFAAGRDGLLAAEGAGFLVLEREAEARERGARVRARIRATGRAFDPSATAIGWGRDAGGLAAAARRVLDEAGVAVGGVVSGASGSWPGDRLEAEVLHRTFPGGLPPVLAPAEVLGAYGSGLLAPLVLAAQGLEWSPAAVAREVPLHRGRFGGEAVLATGLASGGAAAWAVVSPPHRVG